MPICLPFLSHLLRSPPAAPAPAAAAAAAAEPPALRPALPPAADPAAPPAAPPATPASAAEPTSPAACGPPPAPSAVVALSWLPGIDGATAASTSMVAANTITGEYRRPNCPGFNATTQPPVT